MNAIVNSLHKQIFGDTWIYNESILKRYAVSLKLRNIKTGEEFKAALTKYVEAYSETEAGILAAAKYSNPLCIVIASNATALNRI